MRILYHHRTLGDGAEGIHIREMIAAFRSLGHEVRVVALVGEDDGKSTGPGQGRWGFVSRVIPSAVYELAELAYNVIGRRSVSRAIRAFRPDFVYDRYNSYSTGAVTAARRAGIPVILEVNAPVAYERTAYENLPLKFPGLACKYEAKICGAADRIFTVSTPLRRFLIDERGVPDDRVSVLPNGANPTSFDPTLDGAPVRERYGIRAGVVMGFVGILRPWHGLDLLLGAFKTLVDEGVDGHLLIVGDGPMEEPLKAEAGSMGLKSRVTFTGRVPHAEMSRHVAAMDVAVSPRATFYASPMKILEYMAMGVPTVAPRMDNIADIVTDEEDGLLFEPEEPASLTLALRRLAREPGLRRQLGDEARRKVETRLNWESNALQVIEAARALGAREAEPAAVRG